MTVTISPIKHYAAVSFTDEMLALYHYGIPQRVILGMPPEEIPMAYTPSQRIKTALEYLTSTPSVSAPSPRVQDDKPSVFAGDGGIQARVYRPTTEEAAQRNLNFALANLQAYVDWDHHGREEQARKEQEAKRKAELAEAQERLRVTRLKNGLDLFNKINGTRHVNWASSNIFSLVRREEWAKKAEELATLQRTSNPYSSSIFASGGYMPNTISPSISSLYRF